jgi:hypothetical protein
MVSRRLIITAFLFFSMSSILFFASGQADAEQVMKVREANKNTLLLFDENTPQFKNFYFDIDEHERLKPRPNDFELIEFAPMSNKRGERWVLVTVHNTAAGRRFLTKDHLVATFANAHQAYPSALNEKIDAGETFTTTIPFGVYSFPIVILEIQP